MRRLVSGLAIAVLVSILAAGCQPVRDPARVALAVRGARVVDDGAGATVRVRARCLEGLEVLEAFVTISQDGVSSDMAPISLHCDGTLQRSVPRVDALDGAYTPGEAQASAFVLVMEPESSETHQAQDTEVVVLR